MTEESKTEEVDVHETSISMVKSAPAELDAGTDIALGVRVSCSSACSLHGKTVRIMAQDAVVEEIELVGFDGTVNETDEFVVKAPNKPGGYTWTAVFPAQEDEGVLHEGSSAPFSFIVKPHATSMAVWDVLTPIVLNAKFRPKVGVKCSADCKLTGEKIEIYDQGGGKVATGTLGDIPRSGTTALYWAEIELEAPGIEGFYTWEAKFPKPDLELPHEEAADTFAFGTARPPEHVVTLEVIDKNAKTPIMNANIRVHPHGGYPYRSHTDEGGLARASVPKGEYKLHISKDDYEMFQTTVVVASDVTIKAELLYTPDPYG